MDKGNELIISVSTQVSGTLYYNINNILFKLKKIVRGPTRRRMGWN